MLYHRAVLLTLALVMAASQPSGFAGVATIPPNAENAEGIGADCVFCVPGREQSVYAGSLFPSSPMAITEIWYRPDASLAGAGPFSLTLSEIEVRLSTISRDASQLDFVFFNNVGPDELLVYKGPWLYQTHFATVGFGAKAFDIQLKLQKPFIYDPRKGNLLVDLRNFSAASSRTYNIDGTVEASWLGRILIEDPNGTQAVGVRDRSSPAMQIIYETPGGKPVVARGVAQVVNGFVVGVNLVSNGSGYTNTPAVRFFGGGGSGATATSVVSNGVVVGITIESAGRGYTSIPTVKIASPAGLPGLNIKTKRVTVELFLVLGRRYRLDSSQDLVAWSLGEPFVAEDDLLSRDFDVQDSGRYFRVIEVE